MERFFGFGEEIQAQYGTFKMFSAPHIIFLLILVISWIVFPLLLRKTTDKNRTIFRNILGVFMVLLHLSWTLWMNINTNWTVWLYYLPLHLCGFSNILCAIMLLTKNKILFEITYFTAIGGALMALLTPNTVYAFPHFEFLETMLHHGLLIFSVIYMAVAERYNITIKSLLKALLFTKAYLVLMIIFNLIADTNYLFVGDVPSSRQPFTTKIFINMFGEWPFFIIGYIILGWIIYLILYIPFGIINYRNRMKSKK